MTLYLGLPRRHVDDDEHRFAVAAVKFATAELELPEQPVVRWFLPSSRSEVPPSWVDGSFEHLATKRGALLMGQAEHFPPTVWVRDGQHRDDLLITLLHEARHVAQGPNMTGRRDSERDEAEAEAWAVKMAPRFDERAMAIKSARLPTIRVDDSGTFSLGVPLPAGVDRSTDLALDLYGRTRPLLLDGWGVKGQRVGEIVDPEVRDGELWMRAQLAMHERYRAYVARLVEQDAAKAAAHDLGSLAQRGSGRFDRWPLLAVTLTPRAAA